MNGIELTPDQQTVMNDLANDDRHSWRTMKPIHGMPVVSDELGNLFAITPKIPRSLNPRTAMLRVSPIPADMRSEALALQREMFSA